MNTVSFIANEPVILSLKDPSDCHLEGFSVLYEVSDGRALALPRPAAVKLNLLGPLPGEEISITKCRNGNEPAEWVICLTARSEQERAYKESQETERAAPSQLVASALVAASVVRQMPKAARSSHQEPAAEPKGTGTYGALPQVALGARRIKPEAIPWNTAFREVIQFVTKELNESGEQWSENSRQDLASTVLIAAAKAGLLGVWER